jgi:hypothetical protein
MILSTRHIKIRNSLSPRVKSQRSTLISNAHQPSRSLRGRLDLAGVRLANCQHANYLADKSTASASPTIGYGLRWKDGWALANQIIGGDPNRCRCSGQRQKFGLAHDGTDPDSH